MKSRDHTIEAQENWPKPLSEAAYHGLVGEIVRTIGPQTEADPANLLISTLIAFGNSIGRNPYFPIGATRHHTNEFAVLVGPSSRGRKGTGLSEIKRLFRVAEERSNRNEMWTHRIKGGLSTGEGLISQLVDRTERGDNGEEVVVPRDSRILVEQSEFFRVLAVMSRPDNTMSSVFREAWDSGTLEVMTRADPLRVENAHISFIGHVTTEELRRRMTDTDRVNGFGNRLLFVMVRESKSLPLGGGPINYDTIASKLMQAQIKASTIGRMCRSHGANEIWIAHYDRLRDGPTHPLLNAVTARAAPHVIRLAMIYALTDGSHAVRPAHLNAALEVWRYCEDSAAYIFGNSLGDETADAIYRSLASSKTGLTRTDMFTGLFNKNKPSGEISRALSVLSRSGLASSERVSTEGRAKEVWFAI